MKQEVVKNLKIEKVQNGYIVFVNDGHISLQGEVISIPYVFESMETLVEFINEKLSF